MRPSYVVLASLLAFTPLAQAAQVSADVSFDHARIAGDSAWSATEGVLDLTAAEGDWTLRFAEARGWRVTRELVLYGATPEAQVLAPDQPDPVNESVVWSEGALRGVACGTVCSVVLTTGSGEMRMRGGDAAPARVPLAREWFAASSTPGADDAFVLNAPAGWILLAQEDLVDGGPEVDGELTLFMHGARALRSMADGTTEPISTAEERITERGPGGVRTGERWRYSFYVLRLRGAQLEGVSGGAQLLAPEASVALAGRLATPSAYGFVRVDGVRHELRGERLEVVGDLQVRWIGAEAPAAALAPPWRARAEGEATSVSVAGAPVVASGATRPPSSVVVLGAAALVLAVLVLWKGPLLGLFYTRLERGTLLRNPNRAALHAALRERPGLTTAELVRRTGLAEIVVRHHLVALAKHGYVVCRRHGRIKAYFPVDLAGPAVGAHLALKDETRRAIAAALAPGGLSQRDLVAATGFSQRLVSYHLQRLEAEGLVVSEGSMPRRYALAEPARAFVVASEARPVA